MPIQKGFDRLGWIGFDEDGIGVRQDQVQVVNPRLHPTQVKVAFTDIDLGKHRTSHWKTG